MLRFTRGRGRKPDPKDKIAQELLSFAKTVEHGFPHKPSAVAYDKEIGLLAIGTSTGFLKIFGKPGVELSAYHTTKTRIQELHFLPKQGRVISVCDDVSHDSIHLWEINKKDGKAILEEVKTCTLQGRLKKIAVCSLSMKSNRLYLGTEGGNIYLLDINTFDLLDHIIYQDVVIQGVPEEERTVNPGSVEAIQENPQNKKQVLIGYKKGLIVLWDHESCDLKQSFCSLQGLESLHFHHSGEKFVSSHADGSLTVWNLREDAEHKCESPCESPCPFGPFPCKAITKVCWFEPYTIFSGGMPRASYGDRHCISVICGDSTQATFDFTSRVVDFFIIFDKHNKSKPRCLAVLCEHEFVVIDLLKENGYPTFSSPYLSCLHSSPITCSQHVHNCPDDLWNLLKEAGKDQLGSSYPPENWPITGGRSLLARSNQHDILLTGLDDAGNLAAKIDTAVKIDSSGNSTWLAPIKLKSQCKIEVNYFPFDHQVCDLRFGLWTYDGRYVDIDPLSKQLNFSQFVENPAWDIMEVFVMKNVGYYPEPYPYVVYRFVMKRRILYYLTNLVIPCVMISFLAFLSFCLPVQSGERIALVITMLLSMTVYMMLIFNFMPPTSEVIPLVSKFYLACIIEIALCLVATFLTIKWYHNETPLPAWIENFVNKFLARILLFQQCKRAKSKGYLKCKTGENGHGALKENEVISNGGMEVENMAGYPHPMFTKSAKRSLAIISNKIKQDEELNSLRQKWEYASKVVDRFFFLLFLALFLMTVVLILWTAADSKDEAYKKTLLNPI